MAGYLRVEDLAARHAVPADFVLAAFDDLGVEGRYFERALVGDAVCRLFEAEWADRLAGLSHEQREGLRAGDARLAVPASKLMAELGIDRDTLRQAMRRLNIRSGWSRGREVGLRPRDAGRLRQHLSHSATVENVEQADKGHRSAQATLPTRPALDPNLAGPELSPVFSSQSAANVGGRWPIDGLGRPRGRVTAADLNHLDIQEAAHTLTSQAARSGKRHRGAVDPVTSFFLDSRGVDKWPPFEDQYQEAFARSKQWFSAGFLDPAEALRWLERAPGLSPETAWACLENGLTPDLLKTRWDGRSIVDDGKLTLLQSIRGGWHRDTGWTKQLSPADAAWLLRQAGILKAS